MLEAYLLEEKAVTVVSHCNYVLIHKWRNLSNPN